LLKLCTLITFYITGYIQAQKLHLKSCCCHNNGVKRPNDDKYTENMRNIDKEMMKKEQNNHEEIHQGEGTMR